jgi:hypothetical protein
MQKVNYFLNKNEGIDNIYDYCEPYAYIKTAENAV